MQRRALEGLVFFLHGVLRWPQIAWDTHTERITDKNMGSRVVALQTRSVRTCRYHLHQETQKMIQKLSMQGSPVCRWHKRSRFEAFWVLSSACIKTVFPRLYARIAGFTQITQWSQYSRVARPHHPKKGPDSQIAREPVYKFPPFLCEFGLVLFSVEKTDKIHSESGEIWDLARPSTEPNTPKPRKVSKKSPERSLGSPDPGPPKSSEKSPKSQKKSQILTNFWTCRTFFGTFWGSGVGGSQTPLRGLFWDFSGFRGVGLRRWSGEIPTRDVNQPLCWNDEVGGHCWIFSSDFRRAASK